MTNVQSDLDLKQSYCRDLRDCQTYFPCAVFSSGFSYLYVIKRCPSSQIFDETRQKCVKNTLNDPACSKKPRSGKTRLTTHRPANPRTIKRTNRTNLRQNLPVPPLIDQFKRKKLEIDQTE